MKRVLIDNYILLIILLTYYLLPITYHLSAQSVTIESLETAYKNNTLHYFASELLFDDEDSNAIKAAKTYFKAVLCDFSDSLKTVELMHDLNFKNYPREFYGQLSGLQLITIDYIRQDYDKALIKISSIDSNTIPEVLYWKAKIAQTLQSYDEAISIAQDFLSKHNTNHIVPQVWLVILESLYHKRDITAYDRNLEVFARHNDFREFEPYLLYLRGLLYEDTNQNTARTIYTQITTRFPNSQFRVQAEDRLYALRTVAEVVGQTSDTPPIPTLTEGGRPQTSGFANVVVSSYEELRKGAYYIQFGIFSTQNASTNYVHTLNRAKIPTFSITKPVGNRRLFAVIQGPYPSIPEAQEAQKKLNPKDYQTFIFRAE